MTYTCMLSTIEFMPNSVGKRLKAAREKKEWSQQKLADAVGCTRGNISFIENDIHKSYDAVLMDRIARELDMSYEYLMYGTEEIDQAPLEEKEISALTEAEFEEPRVILAYVNRLEMRLLTAHRGSNVHGQKSIVATSELMKKLHPRDANVYRFRRKGDK